MSTQILEGIRILDMSQLIAGPSATSMLAELGADVIKLEALAGDTSRKMGHARKHGFSATFAAYNKGKRSIALDLQNPEGLEAAHRLIASCDVMVEAFRPGVVERLGLSYEAVCKIKPDIIYLSFSGFGEDGPMAKRPGVDLLVQGESGIMSITGEESGQPLKIGFTAVDAAAGFAISKSILAGVVGKLRTGKGCRMRMSLMDVALYMQAVPLTEYLMSDVEPGRTGNKAPLGSPAEVFKTQDGTLIVSAYFANQWSELCRILGLEELAQHADFVSNEKRIENRSILHEMLQEKFLQKTSQEWKALFQATRIIYGDVLSYAQVVQHPQVQHNEALQTMTVEQGQIRSVGTPLRIDGVQRSPLSLPALGQQSSEILAEIGYSKEAIDELRRHSVLLS